MSKFIIAVVLLAVSSVALATEFWVASGVRGVKSSATSTTTYLTIQAENFASSSMCQQFIADQQGLILGKGETNTVYAVCSKARPVE